MSKRTNVESCTRTCESQALGRAGRIVASGAVSMALLTAMPQLRPMVSRANASDETLENSTMNTEGEPVVGEASTPRIVAATGVRGQSDDVPLEDGGLYAGKVTLVLNEEARIDWASCKALLVRRGIERPLEVPVLVPEDQGDDDNDGAGDGTRTTPVGSLVFLVPDGAYEQVAFAIHTADGHEVESVSFSDVSFDATAPVMRLLVGGVEPAENEILSRGGDIVVKYADEHPLMDENDELVVDVRLFDKKNDTELSLGPWTFDAEDKTFASRVGAGDIADGTYAVSLRCQDAVGNQFEAPTKTFSVDTTAPVVRVEVPLQAATGREKSSRYFNDAIEAIVSIGDERVDRARTTVCGIPLGTIVASEHACEAADGAMSCALLDVATDETGKQTFRVAVSLTEGTLDVNDLVHAVDLAGNEVFSALEDAGEQVRSLVVDTKAPRVRATTNNDPVSTHVVEEDEGATAFFGKPTELKLAFEDDSDIRSVELDAASVRLGYALRVSEDKSAATLGLAKGMITDRAVVIVTDKAGNVTRWSLCEKGEETTHVGTIERNNEPLVGPSQKAIANGHPTRLVEDLDSPSVELVGVEDGAFENEGLHVRLVVRDERLGYLGLCEPERTVARVTKDGVPWKTLSVAYEGTSRNDTEHTYEFDIPAQDGHDDDGRYQVEVAVEDLGGNKSERVLRTFVVDTTAPVLQVTFDDRKTGDQHEPRFYAKERVAHVGLAEKNLTLDELNSPNAPVRLLPHAMLGKSVDDVLVGAWKKGASDESFVCDVTFPVDGVFDLEVVGSDYAGNLLVGGLGTPVDEEGRFRSHPFVIDATAPRVSLTYTSAVAQPNVYEGMPYYNKPVSVLVEVTDRNLDVNHTTVVTSDGSTVVPDWKRSEPTDDGEFVYTATFLYLEEGTGEGMGLKQPVVVAKDLARNSHTKKGPAFVVDQTAPEMRSVVVSKDPDAEGKDAPDSDPYWFYNERDGVAAVLTLSFADEYPLDEAWVVDPDGAYEMRQPSVKGSTEGIVELRLKDFEEEAGDNDTDLERNVLLYVRDYAGNVRVWSLDREGNIVADRVTSSSNRSLAEQGIFPLALVKDVTAPQIGVSGVESGRYYQKAQVAHLTIREHNYPYLLRFDARRVMATVEHVAGNEGRMHRSWTIPADSFEGTSPSYGFDQRFEADGHYTLVMRAKDFAGNESEEIRVSSFTIDATPPLIQVAWDNNDVQNGMYYRASRTATITVAEHNFDESLFSIETTGAVGGWTSEGDTHTCKVVFSKDAPSTSPHTLVVRGKDVAGNEAIAFEELPFVIDTQAPTVSLQKRVSGQDQFELEDDATELLDQSAYAHGLMPLVVCEDDANLDAGAIDVHIVGKRTQGEEDPALWSHQDRQGDNRVVVDWGNLGLSESENGPYYRMDADDVYTISAQARDLAGNVSDVRTATFSVNRYGSNFFVEPLSAQAVADDGGDAVLVEPPRIVVHEVNVSGAASELAGNPADEGHAVTKQYAHATTSIRRNDQETSEGYALTSSTQASDANPYEGWNEYVYTIRQRNFGKGSSSDFGDGGQGLYRVDVSTHDKANHHNTTARYWESDATRTEGMSDKTSTVEFMLDEFGPTVEDVDLPGAFMWGDSYDASFRVRDEITNGDYLAVWVDGERVPVYREGSSRPLGEDGFIARQGTYYFEVPARSLLEARNVEIRVSDYTGLKDREKHVLKEGFHLTTLATEAMAVAAFVSAVLVVIAVVYRMQLVA